VTTHYTTLEVVMGKPTTLRCRCGWTTSGAPVPSLLSLGSLHLTSCRPSLTAIVGRQDNPEPVDQTGSDTDSRALPAPSHGARLSSFRRVP
jgi:hypothetical protein